MQRQLYFHKNRIEQSQGVHGAKKYNNSMKMDDWVNVLLDLSNKGFLLVNLQQWKRYFGYQKNKIINVCVSLSLCIIISQETNHHIPPKQIISMFFYDIFVCLLLLRRHYYIWLYIILRNCYRISKIWPSKNKNLAVTLMFHDFNFKINVPNTIWFIW